LTASRLGYDDIRERTRGVGNGLHFILALDLITGEATSVDQALQGVGRFAAIERHPIVRVTSQNRRRSAQCRTIQLFEHDWR
jgi:hypothetical protein